MSKVISNIEKAEEILNKSQKMVTVELELEIELLVELTLYAHKRNITLNDAINNILKYQLNLMKQIGSI